MIFDGLKVMMKTLIFLSKINIEKRYIQPTFNKNETNNNI